MMPVLVILTVGVSLYVLTIDGAWEGVKYYIMPHMSDFSLKTLLAAMGQLFYSMSLAMGIMITYGSYMKKTTNLERSVRQIEIFDTAMSFFAGLMIVPAVFALSLIHILIHLLLPADRKRGGLFIVKRTKPKIRTSLLLQTYISGNHIYYVIFHSDFFY